MIKNKRAVFQFERNEIFETIVGVMVVFIILVLVMQILIPGFDRQEQTAKSLFSTLKNEVAKAEDGKIGDIFIYGLNSEEKVYLVYFGNNNVVNSKYGDFIIPGNYDSYVCMCYVSKDGEEICKSKYCLDLKHDTDYEWFVTPSGNGIQIKKSGDKYEIIDI
jgi:hypothetical protein